ncbi:hypothetical protein GVAV_000371 [Gurleya vavrai]
MDEYSNDDICIISYKTKRKRATRTSKPTNDSIKIVSSTPNNRKKSEANLENYNKDSNIDMTITGNMPNCNNSNNELDNQKTENLKIENNCHISDKKNTKEEIKAENETTAFEKQTDFEENVKKFKIEPLEEVLNSAEKMFKDPYQIQNFSLGVSNVIINDNIKKESTENNKKSIDKNLKKESSENNNKSNDNNLKKEITENNNIKNDNNLKKEITENNNNSIDNYLKKGITENNNNSIDNLKKINDLVTIKIKINDTFLDYSMKETDTFQQLYNYLFENDKSAKLIFKNIVVSKFTTLKGLKFNFENNEIFTIKGNCKINVKNTLGIKVNYACNKSLIVELNKKDKICDLIKNVYEKSDAKGNRIFINGRIISEEIVVSDFLEENDVVDFIQNKEI